MEDPRKRYPVTPFMDVYKEKVQYDGSLDNQRLIILVRGILQNKEIIGYTSGIQQYQ